MKSNVFSTLWSVSTGHDCRLVQLSPNCHWIACGGQDGHLVFIRVVDGEVVLNLALNAPITVLSNVNYPEEGFVVGHDDGSLSSVFIKEVGQEKEEHYVHTWKACSSAITHMAASAQNPVIATISWEGLMVWFFDTMKDCWQMRCKRSRTSLKEHLPGHITDLQFHNPSGRIILCDNGGNITCMTSQSLETKWTINLSYDITHFSLFDNNFIFASREGQICHTDISSPLDQKRKRVKPIGDTTGHIHTPLQLSSGQILYVDPAKCSIIHVTLQGGLIGEIKGDHNPPIVTAHVQESPDLMAYLVFSTREPGGLGSKLHVLRQEPLTNVTNRQMPRSTSMESGGSEKETLESLFDQDRYLSAISRRAAVDVQIRSRTLDAIVTSLSAMTAIFLLYTVFSCINSDTPWIYGNIVFDKGRKASLAVKLGVQKFHERFN